MRKIAFSAALSLALCAQVQAQTVTGGVPTWHVTQITGNGTYVMRTAFAEVTMCGSGGAGGGGNATGGAGGGGAGGETVFRYPVFGSPGTSLTVNVGALATGGAIGGVGGNG